MSALSKFLADIFLGAFGEFLQGLLSSLRAESAQREVGKLTAERDQGKATIAAQQAELQAQADAPRSTEDAIKRLEAGSA